MNDRFLLYDAVRQRIDNSKKGRMVRPVINPLGSVMGSIVLVLAAFLFVSAVGLSCLLNQLKED